MRKHRKREQAVKRATAPENAQNGWFAVARAMFDHSVVGIHDRPFTEFEAWQWMLAEAAFAPTKINNKGVVVALVPGQLMHSRRYMATRWSWTEDKVRWFLRRLRKEAMIAGFSTQNHTHKHTPLVQGITICKYAQYQRVTQDHTPANTQSTPSQHPKANNLTTKHLESDDREKQPSSGFWQQTLNPSDPDYQLDSQGLVALANQKRTHWLVEFEGDEKRLDLALKEISARVQPNSPRPLAVQIEAGLARIVAERRDRDSRYAKASKANGRQRGSDGGESQWDRLGRLAKELEVKGQ